MGNTSEAGAIHTAARVLLVLGPSSRQHQSIALHIPANVDMHPLTYVCRRSLMFIVSKEAFSLYRCLPVTSYGTHEKPGYLPLTHSCDHSPTHVIIHMCTVVSRASCPIPVGSRWSGVYVQCLCLLSYRLYSFPTLLKSALLIPTPPTSLLHKLLIYSGSFITVNIQPWDPMGSYMLYFQISSP